MILSEHWGRKKPFEDVLKSQHYKVVESSRGVRGIPCRGRNGVPTVSVTGGGVAILYNEENFSFENADIAVPEGIEAVWAILTPKNKDGDIVKKILVGGIYIAPRSLFKQQTIEHIIESMFYVQSRYESQVRFLIAGDFNKVNIENVLESNGALHQICNVPTRKDAILEFVITDMTTLFHPPTTLEPIKQDDKTGKPSDHDVLIVAPRTDVNFKMERHKKTVHIRPMPQSKVAEFMCELGKHEWSEVYENKDPHDKTQQFHQTMLHILNKHLPQKTVKMSSLDKTWFNPALKLMYNKMQQEYYKYGRSLKWKSLRKSFRKSKNRASKEFYRSFVKDLKQSKPSQYFKMAKRIGAIEQQARGELNIASLEGLDPQMKVEAVAKAFAEVSCQYEPVNLHLLPSYLPAEEAPQLHVYYVWKKIKCQKKTKSTLPIDIPESLRREGAEFLAEPLTNIFNNCLIEGKYPRVWKQEFVTPVPKHNKNIETMKDVRKIASTSDYSKIFESFLLELINEDIENKMNKTQYGGKKGVGTEHLIVELIDRIRKAQDDPEKLAVIMNSYDWKGAFDRLDPTKVTVKCIKLGIRSSIVRILIDFMNERKMQVKMNNTTSSSYDLIGGSPQGSLIGQLLYIIGSDDAAEEVPDEDKFKYVDDLATLDSVNTKEHLINYDFWKHVPSDIGTDERFLPPNTFKSQNINDDIVAWTHNNSMVLNKSKSKYMVFSRKNENFATRLKLEGEEMEKVNMMIHLGIWITNDLTWNKHISELCKRAYARIKLLTKLKYVGVEIEELVNIYCLFIRSLTEYCSTAFHSSLTIILTNKIEAIQKTCLRIILGVMYVSYDSALEMCGLQPLHIRREHRSLQFALKCIKHKRNKKIFPLNPSTDTHLLRHREKFQVNRARTQIYKNSAVPYLQRRLNDHFEQLDTLKQSQHPGL